MRINKRFVNSMTVLLFFSGLLSCTPKNYYNYRTAEGKVKIHKYYNMFPDSVKMSKKDAIKLHKELFGK